VKIVDIGKVQRLNQMALNLQKHNIVLDKNAAIADAQKIFGVENNYSKEEVVHMTDDVPDEVKKDVRKIAFALRDALNEIKDLKSQMGKMQREFNDIIVNQKPTRQKLTTSQEQVQAQSQFQAIVNPEPEKRQEAPVQQQSQPVQRTFSEPQTKIECPIDRNNVAPADVAIDKMFYYGNK
jgi:hypothetical protein